ncbi:hypothetical protein ACQZV8_04075, partial [Magnetococcales bacterium HHB-1]
AEQMLDLLSTLHQNGGDASMVVNGLLETTHQLARAKVGGVKNQPESAALQGLVTETSMEHLQMLYQTLLRGEEDIRRARRPMQALEMLLLRAAYLQPVPDIQKLITALAAPETPENKRPPSGSGGGVPPQGGGQPPSFGGGGMGGGSNMPPGSGFYPGGGQQPGGPGGGYRGAPQDIVIQRAQVPEPISERSSVPPEPLSVSKPITVQPPLRARMQAEWSLMNPPHKGGDAAWWSIFSSWKSFVESCVQPNLAMKLERLACLRWQEESEGVLHLELFAPSRVHLHDRLEAQLSQALKMHGFSDISIIFCEDRPEHCPEPLHVWQTRQAEEKQQRLQQSVLENQTVQKVMHRFGGEVVCVAPLSSYKERLYLIKSRCSTLR